MGLQNGTQAITQTIRIMDTVPTAKGNAISSLNKIENFFLTKIKIRAIVSLVKIAYAEN